MTEEKKQYIQSILDLLSNLYNELYANGKVSFPLSKINFDKLESVVKTVESSYFGKERFPTIKNKAAVYFCLLIKSHSMTDGNKRLALMFLVAFCEIHKLEISLPKHITLDVLAVTVAEIDIDIDKVYFAVERMLFK